MNEKRQWTDANTNIRILKKDFKAAIIKILPQRIAILLKRKNVENLSKEMDVIKKEPNGNCSTENIITKIKNLLNGLTRKRQESRISELEDWSIELKQNGLKKMNSVQGLVGK